jgi:hypothetical protein
MIGPVPRGLRQSYLHHCYRRVSKCPAKHGEIVRRRDEETLQPQRCSPAASIVAWGGAVCGFFESAKWMQPTGLSRMTICRLELAGEFPERRQLSRNSGAWLADISQ